MMRAMPRYICAKTASDEYCFVKMNQHGSPPNGGACTSSRTSSACKQHLESFSPRGCCVRTILGMYDLFGGDMSTMTQESLALFTDNAITLPPACSKNAFELKVQ